MQPCFLLVKSLLITESAEQGDTAMHRQPVNLLRCPKKINCQKPPVSPYTVTWTGLMGAVRPTPVSLSLRRPLLDELPLRGCEHRNSTSQNQAFLADNNSRLWSWTPNGASSFACWTRNKGSPALLEPYRLCSTNSTTFFWSINSSNMTQRAVTHSS